MASYETKRIFARNLNNLLEKKDITQIELANQMDVAASTVSSWCNGEKMPRMDKVEWMAHYFGVPTSNLIESELNNRDKRDIAKNLEQMMSQLEDGGDLMFDGNPMSDDARESIRAALQIGLEMAKVKNKERFTPKKYREG